MDLTITGALSIRACGQNQNLDIAEPQALTARQQTSPAARLNLPA